MDYKSIKLLVLTVAVSGLLGLLRQPVAFALPFNQDMSYGQNMPAGSIMRPRAPNTVPLGALADRVGSREEANALVNPQSPNDKFALASGQRLWEIHCVACHGYYKESAEGLQYTPGKVSSQVPGPDVTADMIASKSDGHFYGYIHFGGLALMPAYGWKLSPTEHWDIVTYIRHVQELKRASQ